MMIGGVVTARILGKTGFGEFGMINSTILMISTFASVGLGLTCTTHIARYRRSDVPRAERILGMMLIAALIAGSFMALALALGAAPLAARVLNAPQLTSGLRLAAFVALTGTIVGVLRGAMAGFEAFRSMAIVDASQGLISLPLRIAGVYFLGLRGAVLALVVNSLVRLALYSLALRQVTARHAFRANFADAKEEVGTFWAFSLPAMGSSMVLAAVQWCSGAMLVNTRDGYAQLGLFNAANQWRILLGVLPAMCSRVTVPILAERLGGGDRKGSTRVISAAFFVPLVAITLAVTALVVARGSIMDLYGAGFEEGTIILVVLALTAIAFAVIDPSKSYLAVIGRMRVNIMLDLAWAGLVLGLFWHFSHLGAYGLALSLLTASLLRAGCAIVILVRR